MRVEVKAVKHYRYVVVVEERWESGRWKKRVMKSFGALSPEAMRRARLWIAVANVHRAALVLRDLTAGG